MTHDAIDSRIYRMSTFMILCLIYGQVSPASKWVDASLIILILITAAISTYFSFPKDKRRN